MNDWSLLKILAVGSAILLVLLWIGFSISSPDFGFTESQEDLQDLFKFEGISNVEMTGYQWFACSTDDAFHTGFRGVKNGQVINGVVCRGLWLKARTIRYQ